MIDDHRQLPEQLARLQQVFDLFRLHPKTADLHLVIQAPDDLDALLGPTRQVTGTVEAHPLAIGQLVQPIAFGRHLQGAQVTGAHPWPGDVDFTAVIFAYRLAVLIQQVNRGIGNRYAQVAIVVPPLEGTAGGEHRGLHPCVGGEILWFN